jgi:hypothetical protein
MAPEVDLRRSALNSVGECTAPVFVFLASFTVPPGVKWRRTPLLRVR